MTISRTWADRGLRAALLALAMTSSPVPRAAAQDPGPSSASRPILLLGDHAYPPLSYLRDGKPAGMDVEIAHALAAAMGREIRVELMDWGAAQAKVLAGEADGLLSMSTSPERRGRYDFTEPTFQHEYRLFVRRDDVTVTSAGLGAGKRVGVTPGGFPRTVLGVFPSVEPVLIADYADGFRRLNEGSIDAVAADSWVAAYIIQDLRLPNITIAGEPFAVARAAIAVHKGEAAIVADINRAVRVLQANGTIPRIQARWQPKDVLFLSRERLWNLAALAAGILGLILLAVMTVWVLTLKREVRVRKAVEAALLESDQRLQAALAAAEMGAFQWSAGTGKLRSDASLMRLLGRQDAPVEESFETLLEVVVPDDREAVRAAGERVVNEPEGGSAEFRFVRPDGEVRWLRGRARAMSTAAGLTSVTGAAVDITDLKRAEEQRDRLRDQLRHAQRLESLGRLAGGIAHDFNNLLTVIGGYGDVLVHELRANDRLRRQVREIRAAADRASTMTRQLLTFSRKQTAETRAVHLNRVIGEAVGMLSRLVRENVEIETLLHAEPDVVLVDPVEMDQILMNLAANGRDAMPEGGRLVIETSNAELGGADLAGHDNAEPGPHVVLTVTDTGTGMDAERLEHIFEPFYTTKGAGKGTGLGLATVHGIVTNAGGLIVVESEPGRGTSFRIHLPAAQTAAIDPPPAAVARGARGTESILVVEDQGSLRRLVAEILRAHGYTVLEASRGSEALEVEERYAGSIDLLLTDIVMPGMSGVELAGRLRLLRPGLRALYMSGHDDELPRPGGVSDVDIDFLHKPFSPDVLTAKVRDVLGPPAVEATTATTRVLVVDDQEPIRRLFHDILRGSGHEVLLAADGREALRIVDGGQPVDLVLIDLAMPEKEGIEAIRAIRAARPEILVIVMSGSFGESLPAMARALGADATLAKPVHADLLRSLVHDLLSRARGTPAGM